MCYWNDGNFGFTFYEFESVSTQVTVQFAHVGGEANEIADSYGGLDIYGQWWSTCNQALFLFEDVKLDLDPDLVIL